MPEHVRSVECCYCGASTLINLRETDANSLKCGECGAGLVAAKMTLVSAPNRPKQPESQPVLREEFRDRSRDDDDRRKKPKRKKKKGLFDRLEDLWDDVEDIFD